MRIELLFIEGCPNLSLARRNLTTALRRSGIEDVEVIERLVGPEDHQAPPGMHGSPTILIDGVDPCAPERNEVSVCCRRYPAAHGATGAPTVNALIDALASVRR